MVLKWSSTNATAGSITHIGSVNPNGSLNILPSSAQTTVFAATMTGPGGTGTCSVTVTISNVGGSGGYSGGSYTGGTYSVGGGTANPNDTGTYVQDLKPYSINPSDWQTQPSSNKFSQTPASANSGGSGGGGGVASWLVPCGGSPGQPTIPTIAAGCNLCNFGQLIQNIINFLIIISVPLSAALFAWAGFLLFSAGDNKGKVTQAHKIFSSVFIGLVIALSGYLIVQTLMNALLNKNFAQGGWSWRTLQCSTDRPMTSNVSQIFNNLFNPTGTGGGITVPTTSGGGGGTATGNVLQGVNNSAQYGTQFQTACNSDTACISAAQALCAIESGCNANVSASEKGALGLMQILPETACSTDSSIPGCSGGKVANAQAVAQYLQNPNTAIPLGVKIYQTALSSQSCNGDAVCAAAAFNGGPGAVKPSACCASGPAYACSWDCGTTVSGSYQCDGSNPPSVCRANSGYTQTRNYIQSFQAGKSYACGKISGCQQ